jgi:glyoxylase-like metal-dependent hydrolase (beta-lactamase superfamily II)
MQQPGGNVMLTRRTVLGAGLTALAASQPAFAAAPMLGGQAPGWYRFRVGGFECTVVSDGMFTLSPVHPTFGGSVATEAQVQDALRAAFLPADRLPSQINCLVVNTGREVVLLDAGLGASSLFGPGAGGIALPLAAAGIRPEQVDVVAFTHAHGDHCWGIADGAGRDVFPEARFAMTGTDLDFWTAEANLSMPEPIRSLIATTRDVVLPRRARFAAIAANAEIVPGIRAISTPGHTLGHVSYHVESEGQRLLVLGDVANHHVLALMHPDWPFGFDADPAMATATRHHVLDMAASERLQVLGYHFPFPGLGHVETRGSGFAFTPSPWRWG